MTKLLTEFASQLATNYSQDAMEMANIARHDSNNNVPPQLEDQHHAFDVTYNI